MRYFTIAPHLFWKDTNPTRILEHNSAGGSGVTLYTCPLYKTAWITGLSVCVSHRGGGTYYGYVRLFDSTPTLLGEWLYNGNIETISLVHIPFNPPLKMNASDYFQIWTNNASFVINATLYGYIA